MKSTTLLPLLLFALLWYACNDKKTEQEQIAQDIFLTPEVMCGTVQFTDGCGEKTDTLIRFGIALIHHMTYEDARHNFEQVLKEDPDCFWGHWGIAMSYIHPLWPDTPSDEEMESGYSHAQKGLALAKNEKEKLYGTALASYYEKGTKTKPERLAAFQQGWAATTAQFPDDVEAALFNGLFRLGTVSPGDKSFTVQREVGEMAEKYLVQYPDHPGAFHYAIHAYDVPPLANRALFVARNYGKVAPEIPHALHMPSHIFTRLGYWDESIDWNSRSAVASLKYPVNGEVSPHLFHALDYKVYALLQLGEDEKAANEVRSIDTLKTKFSAQAATAYSIAAMPARIPLENHLWEEASEIELPDTTKFVWKKFPQWEALIHYGKGLGAAHSGKKEIADNAIARITELQKALGDKPQTKYWFDQMSAQIMSIKAWQAYTAGQKEEGLALMQQAADLEDATVKNPISPGELLPARELLGDMLMDMKKHAEALAAYETNLVSRPNRFNSLYGAAMAAGKTGDKEKVKIYLGKLNELKGSTRERLNEARDMLSHG